MFSGIVKNKAKILDIKDGTFTIENIFGNDLKEGMSIAHDGACMTILNPDNEKYSFFAMQETLDRTNFGNKKVGDNFNVESSLKVSDTLDGHFVSAHIDTIGEVIDIKKIDDGSKYIYMKYPQEYNSLIIEKGSVAINGVSLTVVDDKEDLFSVSIIPHTQEITNIGDLKIGDKVNLEFDLLAKYINKLIPKK